MRTLIILILILVVVGGAFLSCPTKQSYKKLVRQHYRAQSDSALDDVLLERRVDAYMDSVDYKNHYLWATMEKDGKRISTGVFSKWFGSPDGADKVIPLPVSIEGKKR